MIEILKTLRKMEEENGIDVDDVKYLGKVTIEHKRDGKKEQNEINVYAVSEGKTTKYYTDNGFLLGIETTGVGIIPSPEYLKEYEEGTPIKDIIQNLKQRPKEYEEETLDETPQLKGLEEAEERDEQEEEKVRTKEEVERTQIKDTLTGKKPENIFQIIDVDNNVDKYSTIRKECKLPSKVKKIAFARPIEGDKNPLSPERTIYFLGNDGKVINDIDGKSVADFFEVDKATGNNPIKDNSIRYELEGHAKNNTEETKVRFNSTQSSNLHFTLVTELEGLGQGDGNGNKIYVGGKTLNGNDTVEIEVEGEIGKEQPTYYSNEIYDNADVRQLRGGIHSNNRKQEEAYQHLKHGDDEKNIPIENVDGNEQTFALQCKYVPGTEMTWEELADKTDKSVDKLQQEFGEKLEEGKEPEVVLQEIEEEAEKEKNIAKEKEEGRFREGPWSSTRH